jgi:hypothetical protein
VSSYKNKRVRANIKVGKEKERKKLLLVGYKSDAYLAHAPPITEGILSPFKYN